MNERTPDRRARARRSLAAAACLATLVSATACGSPAPASTSEAGSGSRGESTSAVASPSASPVTSAPMPSPPSFADPFDRFAYEAAYSDCRALGLDKTSGAWGGDPSDPGSVARAYAAAMFPSSGEHRAATVRGCLDAFAAPPST
jgi:hypothetical protein